MNEKHKSGTSLLGIAIDGDRLEAVSIKRSNGSVDIRKSTVATLTLDLMSHDAELVGAEIRKHLDEAGVRERRCVVCVPLRWVFTLQVNVPDIAGEDLDSFLEIEAERGFPYDPGSLMISRSLARIPGGGQTATLVAVPREHLERLLAALEAARLRPVSFSLGIAALQGAGSENAPGTMAVFLGYQRIGVQVTAGGGVAALRMLEGALLSGTGEPQVDLEHVARELRITLGQLPPELRSTVRQLRLFGRGELTEKFAAQLRPRAEALGLRVQLVREYAPNELGVHLDPATAVSPALSLAIREVTSQRTGFEFLPPKVSRWQQFSAQTSSRKLLWAAAAAGMLLLGTGAAFGWQAWELSKLDTEWGGMKQRVTELDTMQQKIRKYRPWFDDSMRSLSILRQVAEVFPEDGSVTAKSIEIRDPALVLCSGTARSNQALLKMLELLRASKHVDKLKVEQIKGGTGGKPLEFSCNFLWTASTGGTR